jgi:nicotinate-nucleotide pyrophosphorylase (carboxylating)
LSKSKKFALSLTKTSKKYNMPDSDTIIKQIQRALAEDIGQGDVTTSATIDHEKEGHAQIIAKQAGVLSGINHAITTFLLVDPETQCSTNFNNGERISKSDKVLHLEGRLSSILKGERTALNLLAHLSGVASLTAKYVEQTEGTQAKIADTRKTTPLWRELEKEAVRHGGGVNHRMGLYDMVLIKENHIQAAGGLQIAVKKCKEYLEKSNMSLKIEVEATNLDQVRDALTSKVDQIMLDNMAIPEMKEAVRIIAGQAVVEASGGVTLENIKSIAECGVDLISVGALTHSVPAFDFSLLIEGK